MNFIDSNIIMYAAGREHPLKKPSLRILEMIQSNRIKAVSSVEVLQEILYRYWSIGVLSKGLQVFNDFESLIPIFLDIKLADLALARHLLGRHSKINPRDALHVAVMKNNKIKTIITADRDFNDIEGIKRKDPSEF